MLARFVDILLLFIVEGAFCGTFYSSGGLISSGVNNYRGTEDSRFLARAVTLCTALVDTVAAPGLLAKLAV